MRLFVKREMKRLNQVLVEQGIHSDSATLLSLCCISTKDVQKVIRKPDQYDTVATLSCEFGEEVGTLHQEHTRSKLSQSV
jgi:hypothetical protein